MIELKRFSKNEINIEAMNRQNIMLNKYLSQDFKNPCFETLHQFLEFQREDGSFAFVDDCKIELDACVEYVYKPTYFCTAILIRYLLHLSGIGNIKDNIAKGLKFACGRGLKGQGYSDINGQIEAMNIFMKGEIEEFFAKYSDLCSDFYCLFHNILNYYSLCLQSGNTTFGFGEDLMIEFENIVNSFDTKTKIFVYGTLLKGESNHTYLENAKFMGKGYILDYKLYEVKNCNFPCIKKAVNGKVLGEVYEVDKLTLDRINQLEVKGSLYDLKIAQVFLNDESRAIVGVYEYCSEVDGFEEIAISNQPYVKQDLVWYVAYGSSMLYERFLLYIQGGYCHFNEKTYAGCNDKSLPLQIKSFNIPYDMYYGNSSSSWGKGGVSFLDTSKNGYSLGRGYLISEEQMKDIHTQEGKGSNWYNKIIDLGCSDGYKVVTISNAEAKYRNNPNDKYKFVIMYGLIQTYPEKDITELFDYYLKCLNN